MVLPVATQPGRSGDSQSGVIGVVGEYVGRVLQEAQNRPVVVVDELFRAGGAPMLG